MNSTEDLRHAFRDEPLPVDGLDPAVLVRRGRQRRARSRAAVGLAGLVAVGGTMLGVQLGSPPPPQPAGPGAPLPSLAPEGPVPNTYENALSLAYVGCMQDRGHDLTIAFPGEFVDENNDRIVEWDTPDEEDRAPGYQEDEVECIAQAQASVPSPTG